MSLTYKAPNNFTKQSYTFTPNHARFGIRFNSISTQTDSAALAIMRPLKQLYVNTNTRNKCIQCNFNNHSSNDNGKNLLIKSLSKMSRLQSIECLKEILQTRFPKSLILKCLSELQNYLISGIHPKPWDNNALFFALRVKIRGGLNLYQHLRDFFYFPLPCVRTLNKFVEKLVCNPGIQFEQLHRLQMLTTNFNDFEKYYVLLLDEMNIVSNISYSKQLKTVFGFPTIKPHQPKLHEPDKNIERASHLLIVLAKGLTTKIKVIVGWHLTASSTDRLEVKKFILQCISELTNINCKVLNIAADMGAMNQGLFSDLGFKCQRVYSYKKDDTSNSIYRQCSFKFSINMLNPITKDPIYFTHDAMHLGKCVRNTLLTKPIYIAEDVLKHFKIDSTCNVVDFQWVREFAKIQNKNLYHIVELKKCHLNPNTFEKMNVGIARRVLSREVAAGILHYINIGFLPDAARTTAIFIALFADWFKILSIRNPAHALYENNINANKETMSRVLLFANVFSQCVVMDPKRNNCWTPVQRGVLSTSHAFNEIVNFLFSNGFKFVIPGKLTSDAIESVFGYMRFLSGPNANAEKVFRVIKCIMSSDLLNPHIPPQYEYAINNKFTDTSYNLNYFALTNTTIAAPSTFFKDPEKNSLYYLAGAIVHHVVQNSINICIDCRNLLAPRDWTDKPTRVFETVQNENITPQLRLKHAVLPELKVVADLTELISRGGLIFVSKQVFDLILFVENYIRSNLVKHINDKNMFSSIFTTISSQGNLPILPNCCSITPLILKRSILILTQRVLHKLFNSEYKPNILAIRIC